MLNAIIKQTVSVAMVATSVFMISCGGESETARAARLLYEQAQSCNLDGNPMEALVLLDSLQSTYKTETEWQRSAMKLRPTVMINSTEMQIRAVEDSISMLEERYNSLLPMMKKVDDPRLVEPYYVDRATFNADFMNGTGIQPRVSEIGQFYFVSSVNPGGLRHTGFTLVGDGETVVAGPVPYDGEMNYRINGSEVITYSPEQSEAAGKFASENCGRAMTLILTGGKSRNLKFGSKQVDAIANCYNFSRAIVDARQLAFDRERLKRQLDIARSQAERLAE